MKCSISLLTDLSCHGHISNLNGGLNQTVAVCVCVPVECQRLKARVVQEIRANQEMEREVDAMDIKIGLLVKNRIDLEVGLCVGG